VSNTAISFEVYKDLVTRYGIDRGTEDYEQLINIISSEVDDVTTPVRSIRFQAIRNFHRGMWLASWYSLVVISALYILDKYPETRQYSRIFGIAFNQPELFNQWEPNWHIVLIFLLLTVSFYYLLKEFESQFTEYLFSDYVVSRQRIRDEKGWREGDEEDPRL
jgi:hypothetical protein